MKERHLMTLNLIGKRTLKTLTALPIDYKDQSEDFDDSKKAVIQVENKLKNSHINHFHLERGKFCSLIQHLIYHKSKNNNY